MIVVVLNVIPVNSNECVPIRAGLFVPEAQRVAELMSDDESTIPTYDVDVLLTALHSDHRGVGIGMVDMHVVGLAEPRQKYYPRNRHPFVHSLEHIRATTVRHVIIELEVHDPIGPELARRGVSGRCIGVSGQNYVAVNEYGILGNVPWSSGHFMGGKR